MAAGSGCPLSLRDDPLSRGASLQGEAKLEQDKSFGAGIHFYPSTSVANIGEFGDDEEEQDGGGGAKMMVLDPTVIFKKVDERDSKLAPEQNITLFALRLAMIEKSASGIGTLSFIWASTIILGGFAANINPSDFLVITIILITEGTRIFTRSRELEWQHVTSKSTDGPTYKQSKEGQTSPDGDLDQSSIESHRNERRRQGNPPALTAVRVEEPSDERRAPLPSTEGGEAEEDGIPVLLRTGSNRTSAEGRSVRNIETAEVRKNRLGALGAKSMKRTWTAQLVPMIPCGFSSILSTTGVGSVLYWSQLASALICLILSCWRVSKQDYNPPNIAPENTPVNLYWSVNIFYALALVEGTLFVLERAYWEYKITFQKLLVDVNDRADLGDDNQELMRQFFYEVYKKCIEGSVFDGLDMDLVEYSLGLLNSGNAYEQLGGARVLRRIVDRYDGFAADALRRIGTSPGIIERLVEMLSWRGPNQDEIRQEVAGLICRIARHSKNCFRIAVVPGSTEGIASLLRSPERDGVPRPRPESNALALRLDGLRILVALTRDSMNLQKIGETRGLVPILVSFIAVTDARGFERMGALELKIFKKVLRLLALLAGARNVSGTILRPVIARVVHGIANLRDVLELGDAHPQLQWIAIEILTSLAFDDAIRRSIGSTGGVIRILFRLYVRHLGGSGRLCATEARRRMEMAVSKRAGDALNLLAIQNQKNSVRMMDLKDSHGAKKFIPALIVLLQQHRDHAVCAAKILRSLMEYGSDDDKREISACAPRVVELVIGSKSSKMQEAVVGLAPRVLHVLDDGAYRSTFSAVDRPRLVQQLLANLEHKSRAASKFPRIRRHSIELIVVLAKRDDLFLGDLDREGVVHALEQAMESICESENFVLFSGAEGLTRHSITMEDLIHRSLFEINLRTRQRRQRDHTSDPDSSSAQRCQR